MIDIGSVAGDRGRQSNYIYRTAKSGLSTFTQGLGNRVASAGVRLLLVKPGLVDTPMTAALKKNLLSASSDWPGHHSGRAKKKSVLCTPWF